MDTTYLGLQSVPLFNDGKGTFEMDRDVGAVKSGFGFFLAPLLEEISNLLFIRRDIATEKLYNDTSTSKVSSFLPNCIEVGV